MERVLQVLDYAVLVISGSDGVQGHTRTLWRLLARYQIPAFLFINKMDLAPGREQEVLRDLKESLGGNFVDFGADGTESFYEEAAVSGEAELEEFLETGQVSKDAIRSRIASRDLFPCYFGSALKNTGMEEFMRGLEEYPLEPVYPDEFGAKIFKIVRDSQGERLTYMKITGGVLHVKDVLPGGEKADALRLYNGGKFRLVSEALPGMVVAAAGPVSTRPGQGLGAESDAETPLLEPVLNYRVDCDADPHTLLKALQTLEGEDPQLHVNWRDDLGEVHVQLMGEVQLEILQTILQERFGLTVAFSEGGILYKETLTRAVEGIGHYEPLRHYAEVHLLLEPGARGSGVQLAADCPPDTLAENWQRLILTHLAERTHPGVLIGAPLTDVKITLAAGRAHQKHTEGGDFRQATYRAVRQGLMMAKSQLLEPWYAFRLEVPAENIGRAMSDIQRMEGSFDPPESGEETAVLTGFAPVATMRSYAMEVVSYTRGRGQLSLTLDGYRPCHNAAEIIEAVGYEPEHDLDNPADSVFCAHGAGFVVPWDQVRNHMHMDSGWGKTARPEQETAAAPQRRAMAYRATLEEDAELLKIFERTYGPIKRDPLAAFRPVQKRERPDFNAEQWQIQPEYLLVDGYNIIFSWDELNALAKESLDAARHKLMDILCNYQGYQKCNLILVFDAYRVPGSPGSIEQYHNIHVVYTKEAETADMFIEHVTHEIGKDRRVRVATSDGMEQIIILGHGALRVSARMFHEEVQNVEQQIRKLVQGEA